MTDATTTSIPGDLTAGGTRKRVRINGSIIVMVLYLLFLMLPIYWLLNMSLKTNTEILNAFTLWPDDLTLDNYRTILSDPAWYGLCQLDHLRDHEHGPVGGGGA